MNVAEAFGAAAQARSQSWWLMARFMQGAPDAGWIESAASFYSNAAGAVGPELASRVAAFAADLRALRGEADLEALAVEHTRLFSGLTERHGPPAVESAVREGRMLGRSSAAAAIAYAEAGLPELAANATAPDDAATELRFVALCAHEEGRAWGEARREDARRWLERQRDFLQQHVEPWIPAYCEARAQAASLPLYRDGLALLAALCRADLEDVVSLLEEGAVAADYGTSRITREVAASTALRE